LFTQAIKPKNEDEFQYFLRGVSIPEEPGAVIPHGIRAGVTG